MEKTVLDKLKVEEGNKDKTYFELAKGKWDGVKTTWKDISTTEYPMDH